MDRVQEEAVTEGSTTRPDGGVALRPFAPPDVEAVQKLIHRTIDVSYADFYPPRAIAWFKGYHSLDAISQRAADGLALVVEESNEIIATGSWAGEEICAVFVAPNHRGRGLGRTLMDRLEAAALNAGREWVTLSVSLPSRGFYEQRGYVLTELLSDGMGEGETLDYWEGTKTLKPQESGDTGDIAGSEAKRH
jgi:GNAT superfamily N-acetyltransferase